MALQHEVPNLLHGGETRFNGDSAYRGKGQREQFKGIASKVKDSPASMPTKPVR